MSRIVWNVKLYYVSEKTGYKVKLEGNPINRAAWVLAEGKAKQPTDALFEAIGQMSAADQASIGEFLFKRRHGDKSE